MVTILTCHLFACLCLSKVSEVLVFRQTTARFFALTLMKSETKGEQKNYQRICRRKFNSMKQ